jgi:hypothetical protein
VILTELVDNALDGAEEHELAPEIAISVSDRDGRNHHSRQRCPGISADTGARHPRRQYSRLIAPSQLSLEAAEVEANIRDRQEAERREAMLRAGEQAVYYTVSFAADEFIVSLGERLADPEFRREYLQRLRIEPDQLKVRADELRAGFANLLDILIL